MDGIPRRGVRRPWGSLEEEVLATLWSAEGPMAASAVLRDSPSGRLKAMEVDAEVPVWFTVSGVVPVAKWLKAEKGTTDSWLVLTAAPVEVLLRPALARALAAALRALSWATALAVAAASPAGLSTVVPATAWVAWVPLTTPPAVLMYS